MPCLLPMCTMRFQFSLLGHLHVLPPSSHFALLFPATPPPTTLRHIACPRFILRAPALLHDNLQQHLNALRVAPSRLASAGQGAAGAGEKTAGASIPHCPRRRWDTTGVALAARLLLASHCFQCILHALAAPRRVRMEAWGSVWRPGAGCAAGWKPAGPTPAVLDGPRPAREHYFGRSALPRLSLRSSTSCACWNLQRRYSEDGSPGLPVWPCGGAGAAAAGR